MNNSLLLALQDFGMSQNESEVYLAGLELGQTTILEISKKTEIKRTSVYPIIHNLMKKGLMGIELKGWKKYYAAVPPSQLKILLDEKKKKMENLLPEFEALHKLKQDGSFIKYYEGLEGVKFVYEELLRDTKKGENYLILSDIDAWINLDRDYFENFLERRVELGFKVRNLFTQSKISQEIFNRQKDYKMLIKILPKNTSLATNLIVTDTKVVIHQLIKPVLAIVITNPSAIKMHKEMFEIIWNSIPI